MRRRPDDEHDVETAPLLSSARGTGHLKPQPVPQCRLDDEQQDIIGGGPRRRGNTAPGGWTQTSATLSDTDDAAAAAGGIIRGDDDDSTFESFPQINRRDPPAESKLRWRRGWRGRVRSSAIWTHRTVRRAGVRVCFGKSDGTAVIDRRVDDPPGGREYYLDAHNEQPTGCSAGTSETSGVWMNTSDQAGTFMSFCVWLGIMYAAFTVVLVSEQGRLPQIVAMVYCTVCALALACHAKTTFTDPGSVPKCAVPVEDASRRITFHAMCGRCHSFKPENCHHCRICDRCVSRMDHHCPWMNNCIGVANLKHFILFLVYTWTLSALALLIFALNYFLCRYFHTADDDSSDGRCQFSPVLQTLVRLMTIAAVCTLLFVSSMIANVAFGLVTGVGTIDRMKRNAGSASGGGGGEPGPVDPEAVFGMGPVWTWPFPVDPIFRDHDAVMGYSTPQRLLRERLLLDDGGGSSEASSSAAAGQAV